jgi:hypothetical protein
LVGRGSNYAVQDRYNVAASVDGGLIAAQLEDFPDDPHGV